MTASAAQPPKPRPNNTRAANRHRRWPYVAGAVLLLLIAIGLVPKAADVETAVVARGPLRITVDEEGRTRVKHRHIVAAPASGQMRRIHLKPGAPVAAGQTVLTVFETAGSDLLDARGLAQAEARVQAVTASLEHSGAMLERARAAHTLAQAEFARAETLFNQGSGSRQELDLATMRARAAAEELRAAEFARRIAEHELEQARALLLIGQPGADRSQGLPLTSPISGRVLRVFQESARTVPVGTPLLEIGDPTDLEIEIDVLSRDGVAIGPGARVILEQWGGSAPLEARVRLVEPSGFTKISALGVEEQRVNVIADFADPVEKRPTLGDAYRVEARIVIWEGADVLRAPAGALFQRGQTWYAYMADGSRARLREVKPGRTNGVDTEIVSGLAAGEVVIVYPGSSVSDGARIRPLAAR